MDNSLAIVLIILGITTFFFTQSRFRPDFVALCSLLALMITGVISVEEAAAGFSNPVVIMIAALFIVGGGIFRTGLAQMMGNVLTKWSKQSEFRMLSLIVICVAILGAFISNTGTVAILMPVIISLAVNMKVSPGRFLIPLAYTSSLGGALTLIGTPPNIVVSEALAKSGYPQFNFFTITPAGLIALTTGGIFMLTAGRYLLPRSTARSHSTPRTGQRFKNLFKSYKMEDIIFKLVVPPNSSIIGKKLATLKLPSQYQIYVLKIERQENNGHRKIIPITYHRMAGPKSILKPYDIMYVVGSVESVRRLCEEQQLEIILKSPIRENHLITADLGITEALLTPNSSFINNTLSEMQFREKYNLNVIGINRLGDFIQEGMADLKLRFGDGLLIQGAWKDIQLLTREQDDVVVIGQPNEEAGMASANGKAPIAGAIMALMLILMTFNLLPALTSVLIAALLMVATGCLRNIDDAYEKINWESVILIAAMLPMATALENSGGVKLFADNLIKYLGNDNPVILLGGIYIAITVLGLFISNTACAVLFAPIGITLATQLNVSPVPFMIAVAISASMSFATPFSTPPNAMVMTAGNYKFMDFVKIGIPMQIVIFIAMMITIPLLYPF